MGFTIGTQFHLMQEDGKPCKPVLVVVDNPPLYVGMTGVVTSIDEETGGVVHTAAPDLVPDVDTFAAGTYHDASVCPLA